ncbi:uncharacterized protein ACA1_010190, partial [Acanthamoeba castellanii str. Neff]
MFVRRAAASGEGPTDDDSIESPKENEVEAENAAEAEAEDEEGEQRAKVHWKREQAVQHFVQSLQASLATSRQNVAAAAAIASATTAATGGLTTSSPSLATSAKGSSAASSTGWPAFLASVPPAAPSSSSSSSSSWSRLQELGHFRARQPQHLPTTTTRRSEANRPGVALWQLAFGKVRTGEFQASSVGTPLDRRRRPAAGGDHVRLLNIEQQQHIHHHAVPFLQLPTVAVVSSHDDAPAQPAPQQLGTSWRTNSPSGGGQSPTRLGVRIGGRPHSPPPPPAATGAHLQRRGSAYDTFFDHEDREPAHDQQQQPRHHHQHHQQQRQDQLPAIAEQASPPPRARIDRGHKYHHIIDDYPDDDDDSAAAGFTRRSDDDDASDDGSDVEFEEERESLSSSRASLSSSKIEAANSRPTLSASSSAMRHHAASPHPAHPSPPSVASPTPMRASLKLNQSSPAPLPHYRATSSTDFEPVPETAQPPASTNEECGSSSPVASRSSGSRSRDFGSDRWRVHQKEKFPYATYSVTDPYQFDAAPEVEAFDDRQSESSFISESDDDADEYGDIGQYGSKNYTAAFNSKSVPYSAPSTPDASPIKPKRRVSLSTPSSPHRLAAHPAAGHYQTQAGAGGVDDSNDFSCTHRDFCQYCQEEMRGYPRNWNEEFQSLLELPVVTEKERLKRYELIHNLAQDFSITAKLYGKIIIAEAFLPRKYQTIKPCVVGGLAGGPKYIYNGIFFKFAMDDLGIYGSDENAMKAAAHDLKGLMRYSDIAGLSVPLIQLIDYRGFRLVALSILPIEQSTLVYGSADGGVVVHTEHSQLNDYMAAAGQKLNLKGHLGGSENCADRKMIYGPTDIEGHVGLDGRLYVLDFSRVLPPTTPSKGKKNGYLYELMRPEFLKKNPKPLSSDAFSPFGVDSATEHNAEIREATNRLLKEVIPKFAAYLDLHYPNAEDLCRHLSPLIHKEGINVRYLGRLRYYVKSVHLKQLFLHEMIARVVKVAVHRSLRKKTRTLKIMSEVACKDVVVKHFNLVLGRPKRKADNFWKVAIKSEVMRKFGEQSLTTEERGEYYDLRRK